MKIPESKAMISNPVQANHQKIAWAALAGLLILRIPFLAFLQLFQVRRIWIDPVWQTGTYLLIVFLVWWERKKLADFHIDLFVIMLIVLLKPLQTLILNYWGYNDMMAFPKPLSLVIWGAAIVLALLVWKDRSLFPRMQKYSIAWFVIGLLAGLGTAILLGYHWSIMFEKTTGSVFLFSKSTISAIGVNFLFQMGMAAISEEPVFRGFLWGYLHKLHWTDPKIWLFQTVLFTFAHIYALNVFPVSFWVIVPVASLVLGLLVWRTRTLASSIAAHGIINAAGSVIGNLIAVYRLG